MCKCILKLLKSHIEAMLKEFHTADGSWKQLKENLQVVWQRNPQELGVFVPTPDFVDVEKIKVKFVTMEKMYSPEKKVMLLLRVCKLIYAVIENNSATELQPSYLYSWTLCCMLEDAGEHGKSWHQNYLCVAFQELNSGCTGKTLLVRPCITTADVCQLCAEEFKVDNPEEYSLFLFVDDTRQQLTEDTYPQKIKTELHSRLPPQYWVKRKALWLGKSGMDMLLLSLLHQNFNGWVWLLN
ncbi:ras and Rab interactor 2-like [Falco biarmicus]|uniref:ras and Rab interactor 2-like n=1 Tax=Falco biarmicus TaxID=345155 RepID=UPI0024BCEAC4|nr:ras and Rab interactor 2-like [Falco biarmicus]